MELFCFDVLAEPDRMPGYAIWTDTASARIDGPARRPE